MNRTGVAATRSLSAMLASQTGVPNNGRHIGAQVAARMNRTGVAATRSLSAMLASQTGVPNKWYTDATLQTEEQQKLFHAGWAAIGFATDCKDKGDLLPSDATGVPLVAVRGNDDELRVFHNVSTHRTLTHAQVNH